MMSRVIYSDGRPRPSPPPAKNHKEAMAAYRRAFANLRGGPPPSSFKQMRELHERHRREDAVMRKVLRLARAARRRAWRPPVTHDRPSSTARPPAAPAQVGVAAGRDGNGERDDGGGSGDSDGGGGEPPSPRLITVARYGRDRDPLAGGAR